MGHRNWFIKSLGYGFTNAGFIRMYILYRHSFNIMCELKQYINRAQNQNESSWHRNKTAILYRSLSVKLLNQNNVGLCLNIRFLFYNGKFHFPKQQRKCGMCTYDKHTVLRWSVVVYQGKNWFNTCDRKSNGSCVNILLTTQWSYTKAIDQ